MNRIGDNRAQNLAKKGWEDELQRASGFIYEVNASLGTSILTIDCSGSMDGEKLSKAKKGVVNYAKSASAKGFRVGIVGFSSEAQAICKPTTEVDRIVSSVDNLSSSGSTNMADGLVLSTELLEGSVGARIICLVTDGMPDNKESALATAREAKKRGIVIFTIGTDDADGAFLAEIASLQEYSSKISSELLEEKITSAAKLLPKMR